VTAMTRRRSILGFLGAILILVSAAQAAPNTPSGRIHITASIKTPDVVGGFAFGANSVWASDVQKTQLLRIDPKTSRVIARIPIGKPLTFVDNQDQVDGWLTVRDGFVWATDQSHNRIVRISPGSERVVASVGVRSPWDIAVSDGSIWVPEFEPYTVARIDERSNKIVKTWPAVGPTSVAAGAGSIWVVLHRADEVLRLDPTTNSVLATIHLAQATGPERAFFLFGSLWVNDGNDTNSILRIDPATNKVIAVIRPPGSSFGNNLASDGRWLWDVSPIGRVYKIDPRTNRIVEQQSLATPGKCGTPTSPCFFTGAGYGDGSVWTYDVARRAIIRIHD
jgi:DNA-binding beta-propeller fold protein YncE